MTLLNYSRMYLLHSDRRGDRQCLKTMGYDDPARVHCAIQTFGSFTGQRNKSRRCKERITAKVDGYQLSDKGYKSGWILALPIFFSWFLRIFDRPCSERKAPRKRSVSPMRPNNLAFFIYSSPKIEASTRRRDWTPS